MREIVFIIEPINIDLQQALFSEITPSKYVNVVDGCVYSLIMQKLSNNSYLLPSHPSALTGSVAHKLIELALKGEIKEIDQFEAIWCKQIEIQELILMNKHPNADFLLPLVDFQKKRATKEMVKNLIKGRGEHLPKSSIYSEKSYFIPFLKGQIDLIIDRDTVEIIDYKSGNVLDDKNKVKEAYQLQLKLYAILYQKANNRPVEKLTIINLNGEKYNINFTKIELDNLYKKVEENILKINNIISSGSFDDLYCKVNEPCKYCTSKPVCNYYWDLGRNTEQEISGKLIHIELLNSSLLELKISTNIKDYFFHIDKSYFHFEQLNKLINKTIRVFNIKKSGEIYISTKMTMIYGVEN